MASFASGLSPVPSFPEYTGPYKVGTVDVEIPVSELVSPSPAPTGASDIPTVLFRIFYPAVPESRGKRVPWLPAPQRPHIAAYVQFLGAGSGLASVLSYLPRHLHWTSIPAHKNATLLPPPPGTPRSRWPTMIFSHGLGGNRNAYSHLAGSLASYGVVVICPEHRDGSAALSVIQNPTSQTSKLTKRIVPYNRIPHDVTHETWEARNAQLRIRLWELGLVYEALAALDRGDKPVLASNLSPTTPPLAQFTSTLDILSPGRVIFSGHSFGAVTIVQLLKSTFYASSLGTNNPLFSPSPTSALAAQITSQTPTILLDMWCFPLLSAATAKLYDLPLPCYAPNVAGSGTAPGGAALLAVESAAFYRWTEHLHTKAHILSPCPGTLSSSTAAGNGGVVTAGMFGEEDEEEDDTETETDEEEAGKKRGRAWTRPHFFYVHSSAHLNQSDFGVLFPWLTRRVFKSDRPERVLRLNVRAQLQFLRGCGVAVAGTGRGDLVDGSDSASSSSCDEKWVEEDGAILAREKGRVEAWEWIDVVGLGAKASPTEVGMGREKEGSVEEGEKEMEGEIEPSLEGAVEAVAVGA